MKQGDIFWISFPAGAGRAQAGRRPAILLQNDEASHQVPTVLVVPLTTQREALRFPGTMLIDPDFSNKLQQPSVALVFQLTSIDQQFLGARIGVVSDNVLTALKSTLDEITEVT